MPDLEPRHEAEPRPSATNTVKLTRETRQAARKRHRAGSRTRIVMEGTGSEEPVSAICRREELLPSVYCRWLREPMEAGTVRLKGEEVWGATRNEMGDVRRAHGWPTQRAAELTLGSMMPKRGLPWSRAESA